MAQLADNAGVYTTADWVVFSVKYQNKAMKGHGRIVRFDSDTTAVISVLNCNKGIKVKTYISMPLKSLKRLDPVSPYKKSVKTKGDKKTDSTIRTGYGYIKGKHTPLNMSMRSEVHVVGWGYDLIDKCWRPALNDDEEDRWEKYGY